MLIIFIPNYYFRSNCHKIFPSFGLVLEILNMLKNFIEKVGTMSFIMLLVVLSIIVVSEYLFLKGNKLEAIFIAFWAPTILGFMNFLKYRK